MTAIGEADTPMLRSARLGCVHDAIGARGKLRGAFELLLIDEARVLGERHRIRHAPHQARLPIATLPEQRRYHLRRVAPGLDHIGTEVSRRLHQLLEGFRRETFAREREIERGHAILPQHRRGHGAQRQACDLRLHTLTRQAR